MRVVGVPVIDGDPVQPRAEIGSHLPREIAREGLQIGHLAGVLGRDDEAEMVPVVLAPLGEGEHRRRDRCRHRTSAPSRRPGVTPSRFR